MSRPRSQRGWLSEEMPKRGKLPRGRFFGRWRVYFRGPDGREGNKKAEKIIDRDLAAEMGFELAYDGPLTKTDARKVLEKLIRESNASPASVASAKMTFADLAREYIAMSQAGWLPHTRRVNVAIIEYHLIAKLGTRPARQLTDVELQGFMNEYVEKGTSKSLISKIRLFLRAILKRAVKKQIVSFNPAEDVRAKSTKKSSELWHPAEECAALYAELSGRDHLAARILVQLGLRSEELFALRRNDVRGEEMVIDEAIQEGDVKDTKTEASEGSVFIPPDLAIELKHHLDMIDPSPTAWLFPSSRKGIPTRPGDFLKRVLKPAAIRAGIAPRRNASGKETTGLNFQSLRRTSSTLFGARAKDPKLVQAHLRHADPQVTLEHYQKAIPAEVKAAAIALEADLLEQERKRRDEPGVGNARLV
jgi:integrase